MWSRRAAWHLSRTGGSWDRVEADLRAACDVDPGLSGLGRAGVRNWLLGQAATTWAPLGDQQRQRLEGLLSQAGLAVDERRTVAFHAGIGHSAEPPVDALPEGRRSALRLSPWWRR